MPSEDFGHRQPRAVQGSAFCNPVGTAMSPKSTRGSSIFLPAKQNMKTREYTCSSNLVNVGHVYFNSNVLTYLLRLALAFSNRVETLNSSSSIVLPEEKEINFF